MISSRGGTTCAETGERDGVRRGTSLLAVQKIRHDFKKKARQAEKKKVGGSRTEKRTISHGSERTVRNSFYAALG